MTSDLPERARRRWSVSSICFTSYSFISGKEKIKLTDRLMGRSFQDQHDAVLVAVCQKRTLKPGGAVWKLLCRRLEYQMNRGSSQAAEKL